MRRTLTIGAAVVVGSALMLTGCTPAKVDALQVAATAYTDLVEPAWTVDADLVGDPVAEDGVVASYTRSGSKLQVRAWDAKTGKQLWQDSAVPGAAPGGVELDLYLVHQDGVPLVAYLHKVDSDFQRLVLKRLDTGVDVDTAEEPMYVVSRPGECADEQDLCVNAYLPKRLAQGTANYRIDLAAKRVDRDEDAAIPANSRLLGVHVFSTNDRSSGTAEQLGLAEGGKVQWQQPFSRAFAKGYSSDYGWTFRDGDDASVVVGSASTKWKHKGDVYVHDLADQMTIGIDKESGDVLWRLPGVYACRGLDLADDLVTKVMPLCRYTGVRTAYTTGKKDTTEDFAAELLGVDVATGKTVWKRALPADDVTLFGPFFASRSTTKLKVLGLEKGVQLVDLKTGRGVAAPEQGSYACATERKGMKVKAPHTGTKMQESTGFSIGACDLDGEKIDRALSSQAVRSVGVDAGGDRYVLATTSGLSGYDLQATR